MFRRATVARSAGSEQRLRGGSGPRSSFITCAGLMIPSASNAGPLFQRGQPSQRGQLLWRRQLFWRRGNDTIGGRRLRGGQWPPIHIIVVLRQLRNLQLARSWHNLCVVALNHERMVDKGRHPVALYSPVQRSRRSTLQRFTAPLLHCSTAVAPRSTASLLSLPASPLRTAQKNMVN